MAKITVFGIEIEDTCAQYLELVVKYATSGDSDEREVRRAAFEYLEKL
jgi:hypothetical protein